MFEDIESLFGFNARAKKGGSLSFGESGAARFTDQGANLLLFAGPAFLPDISFPFLTIESTLSVLTAEVLEGAHEVILRASTNIG